jgi:hypothetical protein
VGITAPRVLKPRTPVAGRVGVLAGVALLCLPVTACGGSFDEQTNQVYQGAEGITNRGHDVYVLDALVVTDGKGHGTLVASLIDMAKSADSLQAVTAVDSSGKQITTKLASPVSLPPQQAVRLETNGAVRMTGSSLEAGYYVTITLTFKNASKLSMAIPVVTDGPEYSSVPVGRT